MSFHEVRFPDDVGYGTSGGPGFNTAVIETDSGSEHRMARWSSPRRRYNAAYGVKSWAQMAALVAFYVARQGAAYGFRFKDWGDFTTRSDGRSAPTNLDCELGLGDGSRRSFQLMKKYVSGPTTSYRVLSKPVSGTVVVAVAGVSVPSSNWVVDHTTGELLFNIGQEPALGAAVTAGCQFDVPVRFGKEADEVLDVSIDNFDDLSVPEVPLVEIRDTHPVDPMGAYHGGACEQTIYSDVILNQGTGRVQVVEAMGSGLNARLPDPTDIPPGGPVMYVVCEGSYSIGIVNHDNTFTYVATLNPGEAVEVILSVDGGGNKVWYCLGG